MGFFSDKLAVFEQPREIASGLFNSVVSKTQDLDTMFEYDLLSGLTEDLPFDTLIDDIGGSLRVSKWHSDDNSTVPPVNSTVPTDYPPGPEKTLLLIKEEKFEKLNDLVQSAVRELEIRVHSYWDPARFTHGLGERAYELTCDVQSIRDSEIHMGIIEVSEMAHEIRTHVTEIFAENDEIVSRMATDISRTVSELIHSPSRVTDTVIDTVALLQGLVGRVRDSEIAFVEGSYDRINLVADETEAEVRQFIGTAFEEVSTICDMVPDCDEYPICLQPPREICHHLVSQLRLAELDMANSMTDFLRERERVPYNVLSAFLIGRPHMS